MLLDLSLNVCCVGAQDRFAGVLTQTPALLKYPLPATTVPMLPSLVLATFIRGCCCFSHFTNAYLCACVHVQFKAIYARGTGERLRAAAAFGQMLIGALLKKK